MLLCLGLAAQGRRKARRAVALGFNTRNGHPLARRVSHSLLDPLLLPWVAPIYAALRIPRGFPPEGIVIIGHLIAAAGAFGFAYATSYWWAGVLAAFAVAGNHLADMVDGTHARRTGQCRNGGELLDHFADPLSFSYWMVGIAVASGRLDLGLVTVICVYATAVLTNIKAKITGEFSLARFGPTEFKVLLVLFALALAASCGVASARWSPARIAESVLWAFSVVGVVQLIVLLVRSVREVNASRTAADTSDWQLAGRAPDAPPKDPTA